MSHMRIRGGGGGVAFVLCVTIGQFHWLSGWRWDW